MSEDHREVKYSAKEHTDLVNSALAETVLKPYNIFRHINVSGKNVVDIGCGDGAITLKSIYMGANYALGIDGKKDMIDIANAAKKGRANVEFKEAFIEDIIGYETFDIAIMSYLLNNAKDFDQLKKQCINSATFLKKGGIAVIYNNNPFDKIGGDFTKYGFRKKMTGTREGSKIIYDYRPVINEDIINYYISPERHEQALMEAGFTDIMWRELRKTIIGTNNSSINYWHEYFNRNHLPVIAIVAKK